MEMKDDEQRVEQFKGQTRLPNFAVPKRYDLTLKPDLSACTFSGTVRIDLSILSATKFLVLNALELDIGEVWFTDSLNKKWSPSNVVVDGEDEILVVVFDQVLGVGDGVLGIGFSGVLNEHLKGFYRGTYIDGNVKKNMAVTQFEAVDARTCFPCWDEPALKATFKITVDVPPDLTALSNMPVIHEKLNGHLKTVCFEESPIMSTYLVAIVVGLFDHIEDTTADGIKVRAYCPVGKSDKGKLALSVAVKALAIFSKYFSMPYPLPKLDMVAVPDFSGGAMENYGLIIYREIELLHAAASKQRLVIVVAHEVAHQWFGNLVTMEWWTHLWLNEGFATWISYLVADTLFPEWKVWTQFLEVTTSGLHMDALKKSHPIEVEVHHARSVLEIFDAISYEKGSSVIRMLQDYLGDDTFQKSLSSYMKKYACKNAKTEDLWRVISEESGIQVNAMMDSWTKQQGYPVITVKSKDNILEFEQCKKFMLERKLDRMDLTEPCLFSTGTLSLFEKEDQDIFDEHSWVKLNIGQTGFYRVKYDEKLTARLRRAIEDNCLSAVDKFGILDDTYALCEAGEVSLASLISLMNIYRKELDDNVLSRLVDICLGVAKISSDAIPRSVHYMKQLFINILLPSAERLGWEPVPGENHSSTLLRERVLRALATFDHDKTHEEALKRFHIYLNDRSTSCLPVDSRRAAYTAIMRRTGNMHREGFELLLELYREADAVHEKTQILRSMGSCADPEIILEVLNFMLSDEVREQEVVYVLPGLCLEGRETAWRWFKENWDLILNKYGAGLLLTNFVKGIVIPFCSHEKADEIEAFFANRVVPAIAMNLSHSVEQVRIKARWVENIRQEEFLEELVENLASSG